ncbi:hypothetical protein [Catellatospora methionotrophica]|uniref:hypothetical protein n=1 Tax=Catellatospora methionotrophica TaxID=121620 RepID=UPI0033C141AD
MPGRHNKRPASDAAANPSELDYLAPDRLRIGSVGVFAGEWAWYGDPSRVPVGFVGTLLDRVNGWAVFTCTGEVAAAIIADNERRRGIENSRLAAANATGSDLTWQVDRLCPPLWFDGDVIVFDETARHDDTEVTRYEPDGQGRYQISGDSWCWQAVDPSRCDHIVGAIPAREAAQEFVMALHTPLRMPHDRLTVVAMEHMNVSRGLAYTATLHLDGQYVGLIECQGSGMPTIYQTAGRGFGWRELGEFVAGCRWQGEPTSEEMVLEALISEYETNAIIKDCKPFSEAVVALRADDGDLLNLEYRLDKRHMAAGDPQQMATALTKRVVRRYPYLDMFTWQFWWDGQWRTLGTVDAAPIRAAEGQ